jgi:hypothetical protein
MPTPRPTLLLAALAACGTADARESLVTIDTLPGGIPRVTTAAPIDSGMWSLVHERDVRPAEGEPGELMEPNDLALADDGTLYVVEGQPTSINVYGPDGRFLKELAREGSGPGEVQSAWIAVRGDTLAIQDPSQSRGTTINGRDGTLLSTRPTACCYWYPLGMDGQGRAVARMMLPPDSTTGPRQGYIRFGMTGESTDTAIVPERAEPSGLKQWMVTRGTQGMFMRQVPLRPRGVHAVDPTGGFVTGWSGEYALVTSSNGSDTSMVFRRPFTPEPVTAALKQAIVDNVIAQFDDQEMGVDEAELRKAFDPAAIPDQRPAFEGIWVDREGRRWVRLSSADTSSARFDLFDRDGRWLDQVTIPANDWPREAWQPTSFSRDRVAVILEGEDGLPLIRIFRIVRKAE